MALQMVSIPSAKLGKSTGVGSAIGGLAQIYSNLPADAKEDIYRWFTESADDRARRESNEEAYENGKTAARNAGVSQNLKDWKTVEPNGTPEPEEATSDYGDYKQAIESATPEEPGDLSWVTEPDDSSALYLLEV